VLGKILFINEAEETKCTLTIYQVSQRLIKMDKLAGAVRSIYFGGAGAATGCCCGSRSNGSGSDGSGSKLDVQYWWIV
jgi:hypothetical protein